MPNGEGARYAAGDVIDGKYRLLAPIGRGGFGTVYRAEHLTLGIHVAVKVHDQSDVDPELCARFSREARAVAALRSPNVIRVLDHGVEGNLAFLVMELLEGETLGSRLAREKRLTPAETLRILGDVARGLACAHEQGLVHRDLKPENIFLTRDGEGEAVAKVLDFGVAKRTSVAAETLGGVATRSGTMLGTPAYMSPEQAEGTRDVDHRSDLWAMGVIAFECLCGERLFKGSALGELVLQICAWPLPRPSSVAPVPRGFDAWFERALARDVEERFGSARELVDALATALTTDVVGSGVVSVRPAPRLPDTIADPGAARRARRRGRAARLLNGGGVAIALGVAVALTLTSFFALRSVASRPVTPPPPPPAAAPLERTPDAPTGASASPSPGPAAPPPAPSGAAVPSPAASSTASTPVSSAGAPPPRRAAPRPGTPSPAPTAHKRHVDLGI